MLCLPRLWLRDVVMVYGAMPTNYGVCGVLIIVLFTTKGSRLEALYKLANNIEIGPG